MDKTTQNADEIYSAIMRIWPNPKTRVIQCTRFAHDRDTGLSGTVYPMQLSQVLASLGWTERDFIRALY